MKKQNNIDDTNRTIHIRVTPPKETLSSKIGIYNGHSVILTYNVKQFIKEIEDYIIHNKGCYQLGFEVVKTKELFEFIDKKAGKDLIQ